MASETRENWVERTGGNAFPDEGSYGMTLRDYFAAKAMHALLMTGDWTGDSLTSEAYRFADAMLAARKPVPLTQVTP